MPTIIDTSEPIEAMLAHFGESLEAAGKRLLLARDGLSYINPDANDGSNDPAGPPRLKETFEVICSWALDKPWFRGESLSKARSAAYDAIMFPGDAAHVVRVIRETVEVIKDRGHA